MTSTSETLSGNRHRQPIDLALSCGRALQSGQTNYIHYCYHTLEDEKQDTIPVVENVLFALALLRSRTSESILEAKGLLDRLLSFQNQSHEPSIGNFPIYLHQYPRCHDRFLGAHILPSFYWIYAQFHSVLGGDLKKRIEAASTQLMEQLLATHQEKPAPYQIAIKIGAVALAFGNLFKREDWKNVGTAILDGLLQEGACLSWYTPAHLGEMLVALQLVYPRLSTSSWSGFWHHLEQTWHRTTCCYVGPALQEQQRKGEPESTVYDLFCGHFSEIYSYRAFEVHPYQLQGALIQPTEDQFAQVMYPLHLSGEFEGARWDMVQQGHYAYCLIEMKEPKAPDMEKRFHPLRVVWGDRMGVHSLVCQGGNADRVAYEIQGEKIEMTFDILKSLQTESRDLMRDLVFFVDIDEALQKTVAGKQSSTFQLGDQVEFSSGIFDATLAFDLVGEGTDGANYLGHLMAGNRLSQLSYKGANRFKAFDWQILLRALRRPTPLRMRAVLMLGTPRAP